MVDVRYSGFYGDVTGLPDRPQPAAGTCRASTTSTPASSAAATTTGTRSSPGGPRSRPRSRTWPTTSWARATTSASACSTATPWPAGSTATTTSSTSTPTTASRYGYGYERQPFSYSGNSRNLGRLPGRHRARERPPVASTSACATTTTRPTAAEQDELDEFGNPTGTTFPRTDSTPGRTSRRALGFNLKLTGDGKTVLKGHWGRYHRSIATGEYANVIGPNVKPTFSGPLFELGPRDRRSGASTPRAWSSSRATPTWAWTRTTRARTPTSTS